MAREWSGAAWLATVTGDRRLGRPAPHPVETSLPRPLDDGSLRASHEPSEHGRRSARRQIAAAAVLRGADGPPFSPSRAFAPAPSRTPRPACRSPRSWSSSRRPRAGRATSAFGLHAAELARNRPDNALAFAVQHSPTLGEAYRRAARYAHLVNDTLEIRLSVEGEACWLDHHQRHPGGVARHGVECSLAMLFLFGRQSLGAAFRLLRVCFRHPPPARVDEHARLFEAPVAFGAERDAIAFPRGLLDAPLPTASERSLGTWIACWTR